jgi:sulfoxide reductase heme-binding subunit YedZ
MKGELYKRHSLHRLHRFGGLLAAAAGVCALFFLFMQGHSTLQRISIGTAYGGLVFLAAALMIGPLNVLRARSNPLSTYLRRDIGIVAALLAVVHTILGLQAHFGGNFLQYFLRLTPTGGVKGIRLDAFGYANHFGLLSTLIILTLLTISNNFSLRNLGPTKWKRIQQWVYPAAILMIAHALLYQALERRELVFVSYILLVGAVTTTLQYLGFRRRTRPLRGVQKKPPMAAWDDKSLDVSRNIDVHD